jgi:hypothetical protein
MKERTAAIERGGERGPVFERADARLDSEAFDVAAIALRPQQHAQLAPARQEGARHRCADKAGRAGDQDRLREIRTQALATRRVSSPINARAVARASRSSA